MSLRQITLDTETTGLSVAEGHRIIEIGCVELINRRLSGKIFQYYINPQRQNNKEAQAVHGITDEFLKDKPLFEDIASEFYEFITGAELIIHNAPFDVAFLEHELKLAKFKAKKLASFCEITDTLKLARQLHPGQHNSLDALCKRYQVDRLERDQGHGALLDARILAQVYLNMTSGQASFLDDSQAADLFTKTGTEILEDTVYDPASLIVIKPTGEEQEAHHQFLELLNQKSGKISAW